MSAPRAALAHRHRGRDVLRTPIWCRRWSAPLLFVACASCGAGDRPDEEESGAADVWFREITDATGIDFLHASGAAGGFRFPEVMGSGVALFDYDDDGDLDLYVTNVGPNVLYRNEGDGTFQDVTESAGVGHEGWGTSCAFVDLDRDSGADLFVVNNLAWSPSIEIDCFNYYRETDFCSPNNYNAPAPDALFMNRGDGTFANATNEAGLLTNYGNGLGVCCGDYDRDGWVDVYVANDARPNQLWKNNGDGTLTNVALAAGCAVNADGRAEAGMGVQFVDVENDGDLDLFMTHLRDESNTFYLNRSGAFADMTRMTGMLGRSLKFTGFGMGFSDFDQDGRLDLFIANGAVQAWKPPFTSADPYAEPNLLFRGVDRARFEEIPDAGAGEELLGSSRGTAFGDIDGDGDTDLVVLERDAALRVLENRAGERGQWIGLRVLQDGVDAIGALVELEAGGRTQWRNVATAFSYLSSNDPRVHFGLGATSAVDSVSVHWPGGDTEEFGPLVAGAVHVLRAGAGTR